MRIHRALRGLCLSVAVAVGLTGAAQVSSAAPSTDNARLAAAGIDVSKLQAGWSLVGDELSWEGGAIRTSIEPAVAPVPCPSGYVCLYSDADMLGYHFFSSWVNHYIYLTNYPMDSHFTWNDQMSSWQNRRGLDARWYYHTGGTPNPSFCMGAGGRVEHLPLADNDEMSTLYIYNTSAAC